MTALASKVLELAATQVGVRDRALLGRDGRGRAPLVPDAIHGDRAAREQANVFRSTEETMSRYFTLDEMRCHSGEPYPTIWVADRLAALFGVLDAIRDAWGGPLVVVCGYRTAAFNAALAEASAKRNGGVSGVAQNSQHVQGRAADVRPAAPTVGRVIELHARVRELYEQGKIPALGGLGLYPGWIHVDVRANNGRLATWGGTGAGDAQ